MDWLAGAEVLVRVALSLELPQRPAGALVPGDCLELEQGDPFGSDHGQVEVASGGGILEARVEAEAGQQGEEDSGVVALVLRDPVLAVPTVGDRGEEGLQRLAQLPEVPGADVPGDAATVREAALGEAVDEAGQQGLVSRQAFEVQRREVAADQQVGEELGSAGL